MKRNKTLRSAITIMALSLTTSVLAACGTGEGNGAGGEEIELSFAVAHPERGIAYSEVIVDFLIPELESRVAEETDATLNIQAAFGGTLAQHAEMLDAVQTGVADIGAPTYLFFPSQLYLHNLSFYVPFGPTDPVAVLAAVRETFDKNQEMYQLLEETYNQRLVALWSCGNYEIAADFPIRDPEDLDGRKIGGGGTNLRFVTPFGATGVEQVLPEIYTNLQTGVYDATVLPVDSIYGYKLYEQTKYFNKVDFGAVLCGAIHVNLDAWNGLPEDVRNVMTDVFLEYETKIGERQAEFDAEAIQGLQEEGLELVELSSEARQRWAEELPNLPAQAAAEANRQGLPGSAVMRDYLDALAAVEGYEPPRDWPIE